MATYKHEISAEHNIYPNLTVYDRFADGVLVGYRVNANEGYVFYDPNAVYTDIDPDTGDEITVIQYFTVRYFPKSYNWNNFSLLAVLRSSVNENDIFGGNNDHVGV